MQNEIPINSNTSSFEKEIASVIQPQKILPEKPKTFPFNLPDLLDLHIDQHDRAFGIICDHGNVYAQQIGSRPSDNRIRQIAQAYNITLRRNDLVDINHSLQAQAEISSKKRDVWHRVAPFKEGIEIDVGDEKHTRIRVTAGKVVEINHGSDTLFYRSKTTSKLVLPAAVGKVNLLKKYLNMHSVSQALYIGWLTYTIAHPKLSSSKFVILVLQGNQGTGKSSQCKNIILRILDPSTTSVQMMPTNIKDLAVAVQHKHVVCFDNVRELRQLMADALCVAVTGGALTGRQLYSDSEQSVIQLHCAIVVNGIHSFIDQPDLAQRCLPIEMLSFAEKDRKSEKLIIQELNEDMPLIMRGLYDLIADVLNYLPTVQATHPERMIDFVLWLAAMEVALKVPPGVYQAAFSDVVNQGQLDSLLDNSLASAVVDLANNNSDWSGTPAELLRKLNQSFDRNTLRDRDWPANPIALSKRLKPLVASLSTQGIHITFLRGKNRTINITTNGY